MSRPLKLLVAFDFDYTMVDDNSDTFVAMLAPGGEIPREIRTRYTKWNEYMAEVFRYLHKHRVTGDDIRVCMRSIPLTPGMEELLSYIARRDEIDAIIISDSNSVLIGEFLAFRGLDRGVFCEVFTNPAHYDAAGCLRLRPYHAQDWCDLSTPNMCKRTILEGFLKSQRRDRGVVYETVCYVGDGGNDLCACQALRPGDIACPRIGYALWKKLQISGERALGIQAEISPWDSGIKILERISALCKK